MNKQFFVNLIRVSTQNTIKDKIESLFIINWVLSLIIFTAICFVVSCSKNDDFKNIENGLPIDNEKPIDNQTPTNNDPSFDYDSLIIYTDIEPDFKSQNVGDFYNLDLNNDGIIDFILNSISDSWTFWAEPNKNTNDVNSLAAKSGPFESYILPLDKDKIIPNVNSFFFDSYGGYMTMDLWKGKGDKYLGLQFLIEDKIFYGWARLDVSNHTRWVVKDYAYNAIAFNPIRMGQKE